MRAELPSDAELARLAKATLLHVMETGANDKDRVAAARALLDGTTRRPNDAPGALDKLTAEELEKCAREAAAVLGSEMQ